MQQDDEIPGWTQAMTEKPTFLDLKGRSQDPEKRRAEYGDEDVLFRLEVALYDKWPQWVHNSFMYDLLNAAHKEIKVLRESGEEWKNLFHTERLTTETLRDEANALRLENETLRDYIRNVETWR